MINPLHLDLATRLGALLQQSGLRLASAESCTGGGLAHALTAVAGSSAWFERGFVTYSNAAKVELLGVDAALIEAFGAVSEPVAAAMAEGVRHRSRAQVGVAITGIAGPGGGSDAKPVGTVFVAWSGGARATRVAHVVLQGDRDGIRDQAIALALQGLLDRIEAAD